MFFGRILILSPRPHVLRELSVPLRESGHVVQGASSEDEALEALGEGRVPDLVITDCCRGATASTDGVVRRFRQAHPAGRHLYLVELDGEAPAGFALGDKAPQDLLPYPFSRSALVERISDLMREIFQDLQALRSEMLSESDRMHRVVQETRRETVAALALAIEARDPYMRGHCQRVADGVQVVAEMIGVARDDQERLRTAALLHELGRISVPLEVLHKSEELTPAEQELLRGYPATGARILRSISSLADLAPIVEHQNTAYSDLAREMDPASTDFLLVSILHVVDAYDAMTSERAYRGAKEEAEARVLLTLWSGKAFHPDVVEALRCVFRRSDRADALPEIADMMDPIPLLMERTK